MNDSKNDILRPEDIPKAFVEAWNDRNAEHLANLFTDDAEFVNVVGLWWHTKKDIYKAHDYGLKIIFKDSVLELRRTKVKYLSQHIAVVHTRMRLIGQSAHGGVSNPGARQNIFTFVVQSIENKWRCVAAHNTDIVPGKETNLVSEEGNLISVDYRKDK